jgi:putative FmdB family regulatory protein
MPLYEYECDACGVRFERIQHVTDDPAHECPECGGQVRRLIQPVGIIFKGSGFYVTDNRSKSSSSSSSGSSSSSNANSPTSSSKPAETSEAGGTSGHASGSSESKSKSSTDSK